jgi:DNA-binding beta-propeller fold protein YncE
VGGFRRGRRRRVRPSRQIAALVATFVICAVALGAMALHGSPVGSGSASAGAHAAVSKPWPFRHPLPGMPPVVGNNIYSQDRAGMLSRSVSHDPAYVYVPDSRGPNVTVISQRTMKIVKSIPVGYLSQHVVPSYDLSRLWVNSSAADELVSIDPRIPQRERSVGVPRPYNLYFTPDGKRAVVMVEQHNLIRFTDPHTFRAIADVRSGACSGPNHAEFSANGRFFLVTCEFSGKLLRVSTLAQRVTGVVTLPGRSGANRASTRGQMGMSMPQDIRLSPDGSTFYIADMGTDRLVLVNARTLRIRRLITMPSRPHGLYPSRDGRRLYISDRGAGEVSVLDFSTGKIVDTWKIPGGGSPDMGGVSADGSRLWLSGRYDGVVYVFNTRTGTLIKKIKVPERSPHGLLVWPQPGRYSLGHTGNMR